MRKNEVRFRWPCWATNTGTTTMSHMYSINNSPSHVIATNRTRGTLQQHATSHEGVDCPSCMCQGRGSIRRRLSLDWGCSCYIYAMIDLLIVRSWLNQNQSRINDLHTAYIHHCASVPSCFVLTFLVFVNQLLLFSLPLTQTFSSRPLDYTWLVIRLYTAIWPNMAFWQHMSIWLYTAVWQPSCSRLRTRNRDRQHSHQLQRAELFNYVVLKHFVR